MSWWWRTKPRSAIKTIEWFPYFSQLEGEKWSKESQTLSSKKKTIHPTRRIYIYNAHNDDKNIGSKSFEEFLSGQSDTTEAESNGRQDKNAFELFGFGYVDESDCIVTTDVGRRIVDGSFDEEDFLKQLLKIHFPNYLTRKEIKNTDVFPFQILLEAIDKFEYLSRGEIALLFGCNSFNNIDKLFKAIKQYRDKYNSLSNKISDNKIKEIYSQAFKDNFGDLDNKVGSYFDYADAFSRSLIYTGLFQSKGRSTSTKIVVAEYAKTKVKMLLAQYSFVYPDEYNSIDEYMRWFGNPNSTILPWENKETRKEIITNQLKIIEGLKTNEEYLNKFTDESIDLLDDLVAKNKKKLKKAKNISELKNIENDLSNFITQANEDWYVKFYSQTPKARKEILERYDSILKKDDMSALWLEVNTWKSLLAMSGEKIVKRNFKVENDLTPKSFAPGIGNTPDMELYCGDNILLPEVSLMTGVRQWEHEASSVIDHVLSFINNNQDKKVTGLFISSSINDRTKWQFFILNKESWISTPVPVIPLTIKQYKDIIKKIYSKKLSINKFLELVLRLKSNAMKASNYQEWFNINEAYIATWLNSQSI